MSRCGNEMLVTIANISPRGREEHICPLIAVTSGVASREGKRFKSGLDRQKYHLHEVRYNSLLCSN